MKTPDDDAPEQRNVDPANIQPGPLRRESLTPELESRAREVHKYLSPFLKTTFEQFEVSFLRDSEVQIVTIEPDDDDGPDREGDTQVLWRSVDTQKEFAKKSVQVSLAGPVAEMIYTGDPYHPGLVAEWAADWAEAWDAAIPLHPDEAQRMEFLERVSIQLYHRLKTDEMWAALAALADHLLAHETLEGDQVEEIVTEWLGG